MYGAGGGYDLRSEALVRAQNRVTNWLRGRSSEEVLLRAWGLDLWAQNGSEGVGSSLRQNVLQQLTNQRTLVQLRHDLDVDIVVMKGLALASLWPTRAGRRAGDVDVLVEDADDAWRRLLMKGWTLSEGDGHRFDWSAHARHWHTHPIKPPGGGTDLEIHRRAAWPLVSVEAGSGIDASTLIERSVSPPHEMVGVPGIRVLDPADHALIMAAESWASYPYEQLSQLVDVLLLRALTSDDLIEDRARSSGLSALWRSVAGAADAVFLGDEAPLAFQMFGRHLLAGASPRYPRIEKAAAGLLIAPPADVGRVVVRHAGHEVARRVKLNWPWAGERAPCAG